MADSRSCECRAGFRRNLCSVPGVVPTATAFRPSCAISPFMGMATHVTFCYSQGINRLGKGLEMSGMKDSVSMYRVTASWFRGKYQVRETAALHLRARSVREARWEARKTFPRRCHVHSVVQISDEVTQ